MTLHCRPHEEFGAMAVQFAGSGSTADRRRRRLAVGADANVDAAVPDGDGGDIESQLVASAAAGPWVPVNEFRIWIYGAVIGIISVAMTFLLLHPISFPAELSPLFAHFLDGPRPMAVVFAETLLLTLSTQLAALICWYRASCKIDFGGRYRVWPWAVGLIGTGAFCAATNVHLALGELLGRSPWLTWHGSTVGWLLPLCIAALPTTLLMDRDVRNSTSSLVVLRLSGLLWLVATLLEIYRPELQTRNWFHFAHLLVPLYACAMLFVGLWLHARVVAYVCPDPPQLDEASAWTVVKSALIWVGCRLVFWRRAGAEAEVEEEEKPKRRRKKADGDETATRRKRRTPAKRTTSRTRTRTKSTDGEEMDESGETASDEEIDSANQSPVDSNSASESSDEGSDDSNDTNYEPPTETVQPSAPKFIDRNTQIHSSHGSAVPAPHSRHQASYWNNQAESQESDDESSAQTGGSSDESDDDQQYPLDARISPEQFKGLSKRQKRDLKKQLREQQRARGR